MGKVCTKKLCAVWSVILAGYMTNSFAVGLPAVNTLVSPSGARSLAMGEVGTALADDEQALYYNPAGLGVQNSRWLGGAFTNSFEQVLPAFNIPDLWHLHLAGFYQPALRSIGGFAADFNYVNFGLNTSNDDAGVEIAQYRNNEWVLGLGWGFDFAEIGLKNHFMGIGAKFFESTLVPGFTGSGNGNATLFAVDIGYLWQFLPFMRFGLTLANMGPSISYGGSPDQADPIPFTINLALAYKNSFSVASFHLLDVSAEVRADREIVMNYPDKAPDPFYVAISTGLINDKSETAKEKWDEINWHAGVECTFANTFSLRQGFLVDIIGQRYETHVGVGAKCLDHFQFDFSYIVSPEGYMKGVFDNFGSTGARDGQWNLTFTFFRMFNWSPHDIRWFLN